LFSEIPEYSHSKLHQKWSLDSVLKAGLADAVPLPIAVVHHSRESKNHYAQLVVIRRNEVLPQEKNFKSEMMRSFINTIVTLDQVRAFHHANSSYKVTS
jgi:hypothetical protein